MDRTRPEAFEVPPYAMIGCLGDTPSAVETPRPSKLVSSEYLTSEVNPSVLLHRRPISKTFLIPLGDGQAEDPLEHLFRPKYRIDPDLGGVEFRQVCAFVHHQAAEVAASRFAGQG